MVNAQGHEAEYFGQIIKDQFDVLYQEGAESGRVMCIALHPYWIGQPHRAKYLDEALSYILAHDGVWKTTADDIAEYYIENYYDEVVARVGRLSVRAPPPARNTPGGRYDARRTQTRHGQRPLRTGLPSPRAPRSPGRRTPASPCA